MPRRLIVSDLMSLDGYVAGPAHSPLPMPADEHFDPEPFNAYNLERLRAASSLLLGRKTYDMFAAYWPEVAAADGHPAVEREIARLNNAIEKVVVSESLELEASHPWHATTRVLGRGAYSEVEALKDAGGGDIVVFGSGTTWKDLLAHGLVDELHFMVTGAVTGGGVRAFDGVIPGWLRLAETRAWHSSSNVLLRYEFVPH